MKLGIKLIYDMWGFCIDGNGTSDSIRDRKFVAEFTKFMFLSKPSAALD